MNDSRLIIGLMSGTSADGIDAALVRIAGRAPEMRAEVLGHVGTAWPKSLRQWILSVMAPAVTTTEDICQLHVLVSQQFAAAVAKLLKQQHLRPRQIAAIGCHGQTVCHLPPGRAGGGKSIGCTLQLGDPSVLATLTGIPAVGNFRPADMAVGGQGAPLVPWTDAVLLRHPTRTRCVQNIGGIANVTYLPAADGGGGRRRRSGRPQADFAGVLAFDTGPGNMLIDALVGLASGGRETFDRNGRWAARGKLDRTLFTQLRKHPYFRRRPPKSTGREEFGLNLARELWAAWRRRGSGGRVEDLIHTVTYLTAWSIAEAYRRFLPRMPEEVILCGGGMENRTLAGMLREELPRGAGGRRVALAAIDEYGIPNKAKEALSFALLAAATLDGVPANLPAVTGAARAVVLGVMARPAGR